MTYSSADVIWTLVAAAMVYFMQAGFATDDNFLAKHSLYTP